MHVGHSLILHSRLSHRLSATFYETINHDLRKKAVFGFDFLIGRIILPVSAISHVQLLCNQHRCAAQLQ
jgi:hypothetical protein